MVELVCFNNGVGRVILDADAVDSNVGGDDGECKWSAPVRLLIPAPALSFFCVRTMYCR